MMGITTLVLLLGLVAFQVLAQDTATPLTLDEVDSQLSSFVELLQNGNLTTRGTNSWSRSLPSGCELAVGNHHPHPDHHISEW